MELLFLDQYEVFMKKFDHFNKPYSANAPFYGLSNFFIFIE